MIEINSVSVHYHKMNSTHSIELWVDTHEPRTVLGTLTRPLSSHLFMKKLLKDIPCIAEVGVYDFHDSADKPKHRQIQTFIYDAADSEFQKTQLAHGISQDVIDRALSKQQLLCDKLNLPQLEHAILAKVIGNLVDVRMLDMQKGKEMLSSAANIGPNVAEQTIRKAITLGHGRKMDA